MLKSFLVKSTLLITLALVTPILTYTLSVEANPLEAFGGSNPPAGDCDWTEYKASLFSTESAGYFDCNGTGQWRDSFGGWQPANGKYQFITSTAQALNAFRNPPNGTDPACTNVMEVTHTDRGARSWGRAAKDGLCQNTGLNRDVCGPLQEAMMDEFTHNNLVSIKENCPSTVAAIGNDLGGGCTVTWSGVLAGAHLGGMGGVCGFFANGTNPNDGATSIRDYICRHQGLPVPDTDCNPTNYEPTPGGWQGIPPGGRASTDGDTLKVYWVGGLQLMTNQFTAVMMQQIQAVGKFFDVKHQLETQRILQQKTARAHKDYHPSEQICEMGTFARDLLDTEQRAKLTKITLSEKMMANAKARGDGLTIEGLTTFYDSRVKQLGVFCDENDNAGNNEGLCDNGASEESQRNMDIDFTRLLESPLTLDIDVTAIAGGTPTPAETREDETETNVFAFINYIFHHPLPTIGAGKTTLQRFATPYQDARSLMAMRSVAHNSFAHYVAMKASGPKDPTLNGGSSDPRAAPYLRALMREMGVGDDEIQQLLGDNPSYYAQMEILTKKIYQNPDFVTNLYDKPTNVRRIRAAMEAIRLMQDRDIHEALQRREMLISMILELKLREKQDKLADEMAGAQSRAATSTSQPVLGN